ncbi:MAG: helix-hairpin-helix domain-containing protein [Candidatus Thorarchaeota archaeon]
MTELEAVEGVGPSVAKILNEYFVTSAELLAVQNPEELQAGTKIGEGTAKKIVLAARELVGTFGFRSALDKEKEIQSKPLLSTGSGKVDEALFGGIEQGSIVELYGKHRSGKTQWCATLATMIQLPKEQGGLEGRVLWLDTEASFKPRTVRAMALRRGLDPEVVLGNIRIADVVTTDHLLDLFQRIPKLCAEENVKLVIIDSFSGLFRQEYKKLKDLAVRQKEMNHLLNRMRRASMATDAIFITTNQVTANIGGFSMKKTKAVGGPILEHGSDYRFQVKKALGLKRKIALEDNAGIPEFEVELTVGWGGFYDDAKILKKLQESVMEKMKEHGISTELDPEDVENGTSEESEK